MVFLLKMVCLQIIEDGKNVARHNAHGDQDDEEESDEDEDEDEDEGEDEDEEDIEQKAPIRSSSRTRSR